VLRLSEDHILLIQDHIIIVSYDDTITAASYDYAIW